MKKQIFICFLSALCTLSQICAEIALTIDRTTISIDETFKLNFSSKEPIQGEPDFSSLQTDFKVISTSQNYMTGYSNGKITVETRFTLILRPKVIGHLTIPSISFGQDLSKPAVIEVTNASATKSDDTLFLETEVSPKESIYPQSQLIYSVRLYRSVNLAQAGLSEIKVSDSDAIIERLGKDAEFEYIHPNGIRYIVLERKYAVFPQHAGELNFSPIVFEGEVVKGGNSFFNIQTEFKRVSSNPEKITVLDIPSPFQKNNWFAAQDLNLIEEWSADPNKINVGEPITWTLTLAAEGCLGNQIPEIALNLPPNVKHYNDKPEISNSTTPKGFTGVRKIKTALIATKSGELNLPEISLQWWDLKSNQMRLTHLPSRTIQVDEGLVAMATPGSGKQNIAEDKSESRDGSDGEGESVLMLGSGSSYLYSTKLPAWAWGLIGLNLIWIYIFFRYLCKRALNQFPAKKSDAGTFSNRNAKSLLKQACKDNDPKQAEIHLLAWAKIQFPQFEAFNLAQVKVCVESPLHEAIHDLNASLYGQNKSWEGKSLWNAIAGYKSKDRSSSFVC